MAPGTIALARIPSGAWSTAIVRASEATAPLDAR